MLSSPMASVNREPENLSGDFLSSFCRELLFSASTQEPQANSISTKEMEENLGIT